MMLAMGAYDDPEYDADDELEDAGEWQEGECDNCYGGDENGVTATGPLGPLYCAASSGRAPTRRTAAAGRRAADRLAHCAQARLAIPRRGGPSALPAARTAVEHRVEMRLGVEGGPADGREVVVQARDHGRPPGQLELDGVLYVLRMFGAAPHPRADWHYCLLRR